MQKEHYSRRGCLVLVLSGGLVPVPPRLRGSVHGLAGWLRQLEPAKSLGTDNQLTARGAALGEGGKSGVASPALAHPSLPQ